MFDEEPFATKENLKAGDTIWVSVRDLFDDTVTYSQAKMYTVVEVNKKSFSVTSKGDRNIRPRYSMDTGEPLQPARHLSYRTYRSYQEYETHKKQLDYYISCNAIREQLFDDIKHIKDSDLKQVKDSIDAILKTYDSTYSTTD